MSEEKITKTETATTENPVSTKLKEYGADDAVVTAVTDLGVETVEDLSMLDESDLTAAGMKLVKARKMLADLKAAAAPAKAAETPIAPAPMMTASLDGILPNLPDDGAWTTAMREGGSIRVEDATYIAGIRTLFAHRCGMFDVPAKLLDLMEKTANEADEPVAEAYWKLRNQINRHEYSSILAALEGVNGRAVTEKSRKEFLRRVETEMVPAIRESWIALDNWYTSMLASASNPAALFSSIAGMMGGAAAPVGVTIPPTDGVRDASESLRNEINHAFRGTIIPTAACFAVDAKDITETLDNKSLPTLVGAINREQMLKKLGLNVTANYARQEGILARYVLGFVKFYDEASGNDVQYLTALWQLGNQINWEMLGIAPSKGGVTTFGGSTRL